MKYLLYILVLVVSLSLVSASDCSVFCDTEGYEGGVCRAASEDSICDADEDMYSFSYCADGSLERCCCYYDEEVDDFNETDDLVVDDVEEVESIGLDIDWGNVYIDKTDIPMMIFFELLVIVLILGLVLAFKKPKEKDEFL